MLFIGELLKRNIFYTTGEGSDFSKQAEWKAEQLESIDKNVVMVPIESADDFVNGWNNMGITPDGIADIEDVEIYMNILGRQSRPSGVA